MPEHESAHDHIAALDDAARAEHGADSSARSTAAAVALGIPARIAGQFCVFHSLRGWHVEYMGQGGGYHFALARPDGEIEHSSHGAPAASKAIHAALDRFDAE